MTHRIIFVYICITSNVSHKMLQRFINTQPLIVSGFNIRSLSVCVCVVIVVVCNELKVWVWRVVNF